MIVFTNPGHQFLGEKIDKGLMAGQLAVARLIIGVIKEDRNQRRNRSFPHKVIQNGGRRNEIDVRPSIKQQQETVGFPLLRVVSRSIDPDTALIVENLAAQVMGMK